MVFGGVRWRGPCELWCCLASTLGRAVWPPAAQWQHFPGAFIWPPPSFSEGRRVCQGRSGGAWPWRALRPCKKAEMIANLRRKGGNQRGKLWLGFWLECYHPPDFLRKDGFWTHHWDAQWALFGHLKSSPHPWLSESHNSAKFSLCSPVSLIFKILAEAFQTRDEPLQFCVLYEESFYSSSSRTLFLLFHVW